MGRGALAVAVLALLVTAAPARGAVQLGYTGAGTPDAHLGAGTHVQDSTAAGGPLYAAPSAGRITSWAMRSKGGVSGTAKLKVFRRTAPGTYHTVYSGPSVAVGAGAFRIRLQPGPVVQAGDLLGLTTTGNVPEQLDLAGSSNVYFSMQAIHPDYIDPPAGTTFAPAGGSSPNSVLNLTAILEADADGDGYGDDSQDLCPGDAAKSVVGCSGARMGSDLQRPATSTTCVAPPPGDLQPCTAAAIVSIPAGGVYAPADGVIVRWRTASTGVERTHRLRVLDEHDGGTYTAHATSPPLLVPATPTLLARANVRIPIRAGQLLGLQNDVGFITTEESGQFIPLSPDPADGATVMGGPNRPGNALLSADVEPDADRDGFGDLTQDGCVDAFPVASLCAPPPGGGGGGTAVPPAPAPPGPPSISPPPIPLRTIGFDAGVRTLADDLAARGAKARLRAGKLVFRFTAPRAGTLRISLLRKVRGRNVVVASALRSIPRAALTSVKLSPTRRGRRILAGAGAIRLRLQARFTPRSGKRRVVSRAVTVR